MSGIAGLIFDKDGTLFDFAATWESWAQTFLTQVAEGDAARAADLGARIGFDMTRSRFSRDSVVIAGTPADIAAALAPGVPHLGATALVDIMNDAARRAPQTEAVPLDPLLSALRRRGLRLGVATNDAEMPALTHLGNLRQHFDFVAGSDSGHGAKPGPGQLLAFAAQTGTPPAQIAMIGDSTHDLRAGRAAGMVCVGVLTGMAGQDDLAPLADAVLPDIGHLPHWLETRQTEKTT